MSEVPNSKNFYQIKVSLRGVSPMIWRRLHIPGNTSLAQFHHIIQAAMGYDNDHLHLFHIYGRDYGISYAGGLSFSNNPYDISIDSFSFDVGDKFHYDYNFFAGISHDIRIEDILESSDLRLSPECISGNGVVTDSERSELDIVSDIINALSDLKHTEDLGPIRELYEEYASLKFNRKAINQQIGENLYPRPT